MRPTLSVIIPTKNEAGNIEELVTRIGRATAGISTELIFVDDSTDDTPSVISKISGRRRRRVSLIHRPPERRDSGLGAAVVEGIRAATGKWVCVIDADLQHPPEVIPRLLDSAQQGGAEVVVASRYADSGEAAGLGSARFAMSKLCTLAARFFFPRRLAKVTDALSGYFLVRRETIDPDRLRPRGFKILLEILVRFPHLITSEVPFRFNARHSGQSKASLREGLRYLTLLVDLRVGGLFRRLTRFGLVGASGLIVNLLLLATFTHFGSLHYVLSAALATQGSTMWNFTLTEIWVFRDRSTKRPALLRLGGFLLMNNAMFVLRGPFLVILTSGLGLHYLLSNLVTLIALGFVRYLASDGWIWANHHSPRPKWFNYDIHGILRLTSEVRLPELDYFSTSEVPERPDVKVRIGRPVDRAASNGQFHYGESPGRFGFWVTIAREEFMEVVASPLLRRSPHVLYTNVVEPILRWTLVQRGYALVHAACIAVDGKAVLVTAQTDTGKTTTILRLLAHHPLAFLSDDMIILDRDGRVLCYPKPLTISRHTLEAVKGAPLSRWERLALVVQSRLHSKSGRRTALMLARVPLPMASINAVVQMIVPPPKYAIQRLIPGVTVAQEARVSHLVAIEHGPDLQTPLNSAVALNTILRNCEDAYGFPPYGALEGFLCARNGDNLHQRERDIISKALHRRPATLIRSQTRSWWERLPAIVARARPRGVSFGSLKEPVRPARASRVSG